MDHHEDDISILSPDEEDLATDHDQGGIPQFFVGSSKSDITPASVHAFQTAYGDLKKRYNDLEQRNRSLRRQVRGSSIYKMASENGFPNPNNDYPIYGGGDIGAHAQGAAAMADPFSLDDHAKQGYINHLTQQLNLAQNQRQALEDELKMLRQKHEDMRQKYSLVYTELTNLKGSQERHAPEVGDLKLEISNLHQILQHKQQLVTSMEKKLESLSLSQSNRGTSRLPSIALDEEDGGVVSLSEFRQVKDQMEQCQENMVTLRRVVEQQNSLIKNLQADRSSKGSSTSSNLSRISDGFINEGNLLDMSISSPPKFNLTKQLQRPLSPRMPPRQLVDLPLYSQPRLTHTEEPISPISPNKLGDDLCTDRVPDSPLSLPNSPISPPPNTDGAAFDTMTGDPYGRILGGDVVTSNSVPSVYHERPRANPVENLDRYQPGLLNDMSRTPNIYSKSYGRPPTNNVELSAHVNVQGRYGQIETIAANSSSRNPVSPSYSEVLARSNGVQDHNASRRDSVDRSTNRMTGVARNSETVGFPIPVANSSRPSTQMPGNAPTMQVCPICAKDFTRLSMGDFQNHVFDCYDNTDSGEITLPQISDVGGVYQPAQPPAPSRISSKIDSIPRVCPVCETDFHQDIPQEVYEKHVYEHFGETNIVDDFAVLNP